MEAAVNGEGSIVLGTPVSLLVGIVLLLGAVVLFFLDKLRPTVARDSDKVYAVFILIAGLLALAIQEITLGESFQMMLMAGMLTTLYIENVGNREPREIVPGPPMGNRPPMPRYDERPPVRRGYRAELDDRQEFRPEFRGPQPPRMNPVQQPYRQDAYANGQVRPPYEEYRGPAGRLQPSRPDSRSGMTGGPPDNRYSDNSYYGERPPATRPPEQRPPAQQRPPESFRGPEGAPRPQARPQARPQESASGGRASEGPPQASRPQEGNRDRPENGESSARALNVRPLSEAPKFDDDYRPNGKPEGAPSEY